MINFLLYLLYILLLQKKRVFQNHFYMLGFCWTLLGLRMELFCFSPYSSLEIFNCDLVSQSSLCVCCPNVHVHVILEVMALNFITH